MSQSGHGEVIALAPEKLQTLERHLDMVLIANQRLNLTSIKDQAEARRLHIIDSLSALPELVQAPEGAFIDLGSGAGYPGIPLAVASGRSVVLLEPRKKRAVFLLEVIEALGLCAEVIGLRAEEMAKKRAGEFAAVTVRAVASLAVLVELSAPLLMHGGFVIALKGAPTSEEVDAGSRVAEIVGLRQVSLRRFSLSGGGEQRCIVVYEKVAEPQVVLPRRPGRAQKRPFGER